MDGTSVRMNFSILNLNVRIVVADVFVVLVADWNFCNNWHIFDNTKLILSNYSEYTINADMVNDLHTINADTGFWFFQYTFFLHIVALIQDA